jgi:hypothetical protein
MGLVGKMSTALDNGLGKLKQKKTLLSHIEVDEGAQGTTGERG